MNCPAIDHLSRGVSSVQHCDPGLLSPDCSDAPVQGSHFAYVLRAGRIDCGEFPDYARPHANVAELKVPGAITGRSWLIRSRGPIDNITARISNKIFHVPLGVEFLHKLQGLINVVVVTQRKTLVVNNLSKDVVHKRSSLKCLYRYRNFRVASIR
jgi:hypothetical protein